MIILPPERPEAAIQRVISVLKPVGTPMEVVPRKRILWEYQGKPQIYIFEQGELSVIRAFDGLVIATSYDTNLFGLAESLQPMRSHFLRADTACNILKVDVAEAHKRLTATGLWQDATEIVSYYTGYLFYRDALVLQQRNYAIIRGHLLELIKLPYESRMRVTILEYIQERTHLSRSSILSVLTALKEGNYIGYKRGGFLLEVIDLPLKY